MPEKLFLSVCYGKTLFGGQCRINLHTLFEKTSELWNLIQRRRLSVEKSGCFTLPLCHPRLVFVVTGITIWSGMPVVG